MSLEFYLVFNASCMALSAIVSFLYLVSFIKKTETGKLFLGSGFVCFAMYYAVRCLTYLIRPSPLLVALQISYHWFEALGLIFISYMVIRDLFPHRIYAIYYLLASFMLTTVFAVYSLALSNFNRGNYELEASSVIWSIVQAVIFTTLFLMALYVARKSKGTGIVVFCVVFFIWAVGKSLHLVNSLITYEKDYLLLTSHFLDLFALLVLSGYTVYRAREIFQIDRLSVEE